MSAIMPQTAIDRVLRFMHTQRTGQIQLDFKQGRLLSFKVVEFVRLDVDDEACESSTLDDSPRVAHDSGE